MTDRPARHRDACGTIGTSTLEILDHYIEPPAACGYLRGEMARLECVVIGSMTAEEYEARLEEGWRRFGRVLFRPRCRCCTACRPLRVDVANFRPSRSMRRLRRLNEGVIELEIGDASGRPHPDVIGLFQRYHRERSERRGWPDRSLEDANSFAETFLDNPFATEQWCYRAGGRLVAVAFGDRLPTTCSAIYCFYDPEFRHHSPGTWNILRMIDRARGLGIPHLHLGYYVAGCPSLSYKARFLPNQTRAPDGRWSGFRD